MTGVDRPQSCDDVGHGCHEREPDADEHEDREAVEVLAVGLARPSKGHVRFSSNARAVKIICSIGTVLNEMHRQFLNYIKTVNNCELSQVSIGF